MAKSRALIAGRVPASMWVLLVLSGLFLTLAGCQQERPVAMVDPLPPPNFGGPTLSAPVAPPPAPPKALTVLPPDPSSKIKAPLLAPAPAVPAGTPREWAPLVTANAWKWIVIHHSATAYGGAARIDKWHRDKGWDEMGYHFVIGNGTDTRDGQIEVGSRWPKQKWGAHAKTPDEQFNKFGVGICLVGNFDQTRPTDAQMKSLARLTAFLMKTYHVAPDHVIGHGDTKATDCPGRNMHVATVRRMCNQLLADTGQPDPAEDRAGSPVRTASGWDLMFDAPSR